MLKTRVISRHSLWIALLSVVVMIGGCGSGGDPNTGSITGQVVDISGGGVPDATVVIPNTPFRTQTNLAGRFTLVGVPQGRWSILAMKPGWRMVDFPERIPAPGAQPPGPPDPPSSVHVTVQVHAGLTAVVSQPIEMRGYRGHSDDVIITSMSPGPYSTLAAGQQYELGLNVYYKLDSVENGFLVATLYFGSLPIGWDTVAAFEGSRAASLRIPFDMPRAEELTLQVALVDDEQVLSFVSQSVFADDRYEPPKAPRLALQSFDESKIVIEWPPIGEPEYFSNMHIYRNRSSDDVSVTEHGQLVAEVTDPTVTTFEDDDFMMGDQLNYIAHVYTVDGREIRGTKEQVLTVNTLGTDIVEFYPGGSHSYDMALNRETDYMYSTRTSNRNINEISIPERRIVRTFSTTCRGPGLHLSANGERLYLYCASDDRLGMINLADGQGTYEDVEIGFGVRYAFDPVSERFFMSHLDGTERVTEVIHVKSGQREIWPFDSSSGLAVLPDERFLLVHSGPQNGRNVVVIDLETEQVAHVWSNWHHTLSQRVKFDGTLFYSGNEMYTFPEGAWYGTMAVREGSFDISQDGKYMAADVSSPDANLLLSTWNGRAWSPIARFYAPSGINSSVQFNKDGTMIYLSASSRLTIIDISPIVAERN